MKAEHSIQTSCVTLGVSPSGYYDWQQRQAQPGPRALADQVLLGQLQALHACSRQTYGSPRMQAMLRRQGQRHGRRRIARLMRLGGLVGRQKRRYRVWTTDSNHDQPIAPNRLAQAPAATAPNQLWVADVTYIDTSEGWLYLAGVLDLNSRQLVGWAMSPHNDTALVLQAWTMARKHRQPPAGLLFHSDRGSQYASGDFRQALQQAGVITSMSRAGN
jgi:putative transposase